MVSTDEFLATRASYLEARAAYDALVEVEIHDEYAALRASDKAAGRDVGPRSVQARKALAYDNVIRRPDIVEARRPVDHLWFRYHGMLNAEARRYAKGQS